MTCDALYVMWEYRYGETIFDALIKHVILLKIQSALVFYA